MFSNCSDFVVSDSPSAPRLHVAHPWTYLPEKLWQWPVQAAFLWFVYPTLAAKSKYPPCTAASVACFQQRRPHHGGKSCVISGLALQWFQVTGIPSRIMEQALSCPWAELKKNYVPRTSQKKWCSPKHKRPLMIFAIILSCVADVAVSMCSDKLPASSQVLVCLPSPNKYFFIRKLQTTVFFGDSMACPWCCCFFSCCPDFGHADMRSIPWCAAARWMKQLSTSIAGMPGWIMLDLNGACRESECCCSQVGWSPEVDIWHHPKPSQLGLFNIVLLCLIS